MELWHVFPRGLKEPLEGCKRYSVAMKPTEFWRWNVRDEVSGKVRPTRHHMTEADALERHLEATRVPGSMELRNLPETDKDRAALHTSPGHPGPPAVSGGPARLVW